MIDEKKAKEDAAKIELADLLDINGAQSQSSVEKKSESSEISQKKEKKKTEKLGSLDKVYSEMKSKNKKLKVDIGKAKNETESLRSIFAEFQVEFKQNRKHEKQFDQLTIADLQDLFAIQQKMMAQIDSMNIGSQDLKNENWAEFDQIEQQNINEREPAMIEISNQ